MLVVASWGNSRGFKSSSCHTSIIIKRHEKISRFKMWWYSCCFFYHVSWKTWKRSVVYWGCLSQTNGATSLAWGAKVAMAAKQMLGQWAHDLVCSQRLQAFWVWMSLRLWACTISYIIITYRPGCFKLQLGWGQMGDSPRWPRRPKKQGHGSHSIHCIHSPLFTVQISGINGEHRNKAAATSKILKFGQSADVRDAKVAIALCWGHFASLGIRFNSARLHRVRSAAV